MPSNLLRTYNQTLELLHLNHQQNMISLRGVFNRDFANLLQMAFRGISIKPTSSDGEDVMDRLFRHLTTVIVDEKTRRREFETDRSIRIHWIRFLVDEGKANNFIVFSVPDEKRIYLLDKDERYVIVFEPSRDQLSLFLLTAYRLEPGRYKNLMKKFEKRGAEGINFP